MKAAVYEKYGSPDVVEIKDVPVPAIKNDEVLVKVHAAAVTTADWRLRASAFPGIAFWLPGRIMLGLFAPKNKVLGGSFAGRVVSAGADVAQFKPGDDVFGFSAFSFSKQSGAHAEYLVIAERGAVVMKPAHLSFEEAAAVPFGALCALVFLRDFAKLKRGQSILINGASGDVGVFAVQLAKHFGAEVTAVCSGANLALVKSLGADYAIDYAREDFTRSGKAYDVIFDTVGKIKFSRAKRALTATGVLMPLENTVTEMLQALVTSMTGGKKVLIGISGTVKEDLAVISELLKSGAVRPVVDRCFPFAKIVDAHRRVESRHKTGSAVVTIATRDVHRLAAA